jgi:galactose mutarotase-like enzyme
MIQEIDFQGHRVIEIAKGGSRIRLSPEHGGRLLSWDVADEPIIPWPVSADWGRVNKVRGGNPILFPFVARHFVNGKLGYWQDAVGKTREMPMHGFARDSRFIVIPQEDPHSIRMRLLPTEKTRLWYPFDYLFDVVYSVAEDFLEVRFETTNRGPDPMPYYAGHHFYFAVPHQQRHEWSLVLPAKQWGRQNVDGSITFSSAHTSEFRLDDPELIDLFHVGMSIPRVEMTCAAKKRHLILDLDCGGDASWYAITTWTQDATSDFFCVEPWLGLPNAIFHGHGLRYVSPGTTEIAACRWRRG